MQSWFPSCLKNAEEVSVIINSTLILIWLVNRMSIELFKFKKCSLQLEPHTIFVAREADGGANHSTGILEPNEVKVIMCHAGRSYSR